MMKALGFLTGVCLTVASFVLVLERWQDVQTGEETSLAVVATDVEPFAALPDTNDKVFVTPGEETDTVSIETVTDDSASPETVVADAEKAASVDPDAEISTIEDPDRVDVEQHYVNVVQLAAEQTATDSTQTPEVAAQSIDRPAPNRYLQMDTGDHDTALTHVFWSPFRSEWAAKGFARRLTNATQIPIAIVETGSHKYRVSFDYLDETQRREHMERIESITGLQLE